MSSKTIVLQPKTHTKPEHSERKPTGGVDFAAKTLWAEVEAEMIAEIKRFNANTKDVRSRFQQIRGELDDFVQEEKFSEYTTKAQFIPLWETHCKTFEETVEASRLNALRARIMMRLYSEVILSDLESRYTDEGLSHTQTELARLMMKVNEKIDGAKDVQNRFRQLAADLRLFSTRLGKTLHRMGARISSALQAARDSLKALEEELKKLMSHKHALGMAALKNVATGAVNVAATVLTLSPTFLGRAVESLSGAVGSGFDYVAARKKASNLRKKIQESKTQIGDLAKEHDLLGKYVLPLSESRQKVGVMADNIDAMSDVWQSLKVDMQELSERLLNMTQGEATIFFKTKLAPARALFQSLAKAFEAFDKDNLSSAARRRAQASHPNAQATGGPSKTDPQDKHASEHGHRGSAERRDVDESRKPREQDIRPRNKGIVQETRIAKGNERDNTTGDARGDTRANARGDARNDTKGEIKRDARGNTVAVDAKDVANSAPDGFKRDNGKGARRDDTTNETPGDRRNDATRVKKNDTTSAKRNDVQDVRRREVQSGVAKEGDGKSRPSVDKDLKRDHGARGDAGKTVDKPAVKKVDAQVDKLAKGDLGERDDKGSQQPVERRVKKIKAEPFVTTISNTGATTEKTDIQPDPETEVKKTVDKAQAKGSAGRGTGDRKGDDALVAKHSQEVGALVEKGDRGRRGDTAADGRVAKADKAGASRTDTVPKAVSGGRGDRTGEKHGGKKVSFAEGGKGDGEKKDHDGRTDVKGGEVRKKQQRRKTKQE